MIVGRRVLRFGRVDSTMDVAAEHAAAGEPEGLVVVAHEQTAGRGRAGRTWQSRPGAALLLTTLLRPDVPPDRLGVLAQLAGVALAEAVETETGLRCWLKWPNDLWLGDRNAGRKAAGVLATARLAGDRPEYVLVGIGLNVGGQTGELPPGATSIGRALGDRPFDAAKDRRALGFDPVSGEQPGVDSSAAALPALANHLLGALLVHLDDHYAAYVGSGGRLPLDGWRERAALLGEAVTVQAGDGVLRGVHAGIDDDGALLLRRQDGTLHRVVAGDLTRGPRLDTAETTRGS